MGTHGAVAWKVNRFIIGVYNGFDSYPTHLGKRVWLTARELGALGLISRLRQYGDWEEFENAGVCKYCGRVAGQPQNIKISELTMGFNPETMTFKTPPDPEVKYHEHGNSSRDQVEPFKHALNIEWVYIVDQDFNALEIWFAIPEGHLSKYRGMGMIDSDEVDANGYTHILVKTINFNEEEEPNWAYLEHEVAILKRGSDDGF